MEKPQAISSLSLFGTPSSRPMNKVPEMPIVTIPTITSNMGAPSATMSASASFKPRNTMPRRSSRFAENAMPGAVASGRLIAFAASTPSTIATTSGLSPGSTRLTATAMPAATGLSAKPGANPTIELEGREGSLVDAVVGASTPTIFSGAGAPR